MSLTCDGVAAGAAEVGRQIVIGLGHRRLQAATRRPAQNGAPIRPSAGVIVDDAGATATKAVSKMRRGWAFRRRRPHRGRPLTEPSWINGRAPESREPAGSAVPALPAVVGQRDESATGPQCCLDDPLR